MHIYPLYLEEGEDYARRIYYSIEYVDGDSFLRQLVCRVRSLGRVGRK